MTEGILKAIKDWCQGKFQVKGEYVTETELAEKNYATKDELPDDTGITAEAVRELIDASSRENMGGAKIAQDAEGNWGLLVPGDDAVIPFFKNGETIYSITVQTEEPETVAKNEIVLVVEE